MSIRQVPSFSLLQYISQSRQPETCTDRSSRQLLSRHHSYRFQDRSFAFESRLTPQRTCTTPRIKNSLFPSRQSSLRFLLLSSFSFYGKRERESRFGFGKARNEQFPSSKPPRAVFRIFALRERSL